MKQVLLQRLLVLGGRTRTITNLLNYSHTISIPNQLCRFFIPKSSSYSSLPQAYERTKEQMTTHNNELPPGLKRELLPKHVAAILDGNRTWCRSKGIPDSYMPYYNACTVFAQNCANWGIPFASTFVFITENWKRPKEWQDLILGEFENYLKDNLETFMRKEYRVSIIGEIPRVSKSLQEVTKQVEDTTMNNTRVDLIFAVSYGGRRDVVQATQRISEKVKDGLIEPKDIDEALFEKELWTNIAGRTTVPDPDLLIRTGPIRLSNYMLYQMAYTELYFTDIYGPDFGEEEFIKALLSFQSRKRNFGAY